MKTGGNGSISGRVRWKGGEERRGDRCGIGDPWEVLVWSAGTDGRGGEGGKKARVRSAETALILLP